MKLLSLVGIIALLAIGATSAFLYSGIYNVAATEPHGPMAQWLFHTTMKHSVRARARSIQAPPLNDADQLKAGFIQYREMCVRCHGAPGITPDVLAQGLMPPAPDLAESAAQWSAGELYWIIKHGVRMTAMPAWGPTHDDEELWAIVALVQKLPTMAAAEWAAMDRGTQGTHTHAAPHQH